MRYTIFGESHGPAIGVVLEGVPSGVILDMDFIRAELKRRAPGQNALSTARKEADEPEILSGVFEGRTTGTPLCAVIRNTDTRSKDYAQLQNLPRPSHADYAGSVRYKGYNDYRGGGHFSGRLTAPLVFAGALAKLILKEKGIEIAAHISILGGVEDPAPEQMEELIMAAKNDCDSVGGASPARSAGLLRDLARRISAAMPRGFSRSICLRFLRSKALLLERDSAFPACAAAKPTTRFIWMTKR